MDISRYLTDTKRQDPGAHLQINWTPNHTFDSLDKHLLKPTKSKLITTLRALIPERLATALCEQSKVDPDQPTQSLTRDHRRSLVHQITQCPLHIANDRGFTHAEVTAGGVPLDEINRKDFSSKRSPNLWIVGELLDVDGRIGGFNFQWAWSTGHIAAQSIAKSIKQSLTDTSN